MKFVLDQQLALYDFLTTYSKAAHAHLILDATAISRLKTVYAHLEQFELIATALGSETDITGSLILPMLDTVRSILTGTERLDTEGEMGDGQS